VKKARAINTNRTKIAIFRVILRNFFPTFMTLQQQQNAHQIALTAPYILTILLTE
jgi:hypothetical protein